MKTNEMGFAPTDPKSPEDQKPSKEAPQHPQPGTLPPPLQAGGFGLHAWGHQRNDGHQAHAKL